MTQKRRRTRTAKRPRTTPQRKKASRVTAPKTRGKARAKARGKAHGKARREPGDRANDAVIGAAAASLGLKIDSAWLPAVREHLAVILLHGSKVSEFALPDDAEPAPIFQA